MKDTYAAETHEKLREILQKYGKEEYGDCIIDEISFLYGFPTTTDIEPKEESKNIPVTYSYIKRNIGWSKFCDVTGGNHYAINEWGDYPDNEIFRVTESQAEKLGI